MPPARRGAAWLLKHMFGFLTHACQSETSISERTNERPAGQISLAATTSYLDPSYKAACLPFIRPGWRYLALPHGAETSRRRRLPLLLTLRCREPTSQSVDSGLFGMITDTLSFASAIFANPSHILEMYSAVLKNPFVNVCTAS